MRYDDGIRMERITDHIKKCPCCDASLIIKPRWVLPKGYDDCNNPVSMYPPEQVSVLKIYIYNSTDPPKEA